MKIQQFEDKSLSHYAYAILSECEKQIVLIDPARDVAPYLAFSEVHEAEIIGVIETHPHADFVSGHLELHQILGAVIYCSKLVDAAYPHQTFDDNDEITFGNIKLKAMNTPGHSPDGISIVLEYNGKDKAVFTGDTLFIGDCGRPDLRENVGNLTAKREELAANMYHSLRKKLMVLADDVLVYPSHGAGTLCGKALSDANSSSIGLEKMSNWSLQEMTENQFVKTLIENQPFVPKYFSFDVELNKKGASDLASSIQNIRHIKGNLSDLAEDIQIIDTRPASKFKLNHLPNSINLMENGKFETWLGSIISPEEEFYLTAETETVLQEMIKRTAKIGYEKLIKVAFVFNFGSIKTALLDVKQFKIHLADYQIIDIRNENEAKHPIFADSINIPLPELRERIQEISTEKPIVVHCAGGYRSAAGSSILENYLLKTVSVYDLGNAVTEF
ncbi:MAG: MBL fold metallo-hydrolase [Janthinobacterium lividum]